MKSKSAYSSRSHVYEKKIKTTKNVCKSASTNQQKERKLNSKNQQGGSKAQSKRKESFTLKPIEKHQFKCFQIYRFTPFDIALLKNTTYTDQQ